ncbi:MAG: right-handed parallel beta-helix repeat-containing protein, partial [Planctomycetota bacterium]
AYKLTSNLTGVAGQPGIVVGADNVTIDLNGFALIGDLAATNAIQPLVVPGFTNYENFAVFNGHIDGWGGHGIASYASGGFVDEARIQYMRIDNIGVNGCGQFGILGSSGNVITNCRATNNGGIGISLSNYGGVLEGCVAYNNSDHGFSVAEGSVLTNCASNENDGAGIRVLNSNTTISFCTIERNAGGGIERASGAIIKGCSIQSNTGFGIWIGFASHIEGNRISSTIGGSGIIGTNIGGSGDSYISNNLIRGNSAWGIDLNNNPGNFIYNNMVRTNTTGAINAPGSDAPISVSSVGAGPLDNIGN